MCWGLEMWGLRLGISAGMQVNLMGSKSIYVSDMNWLDSEFQPHPEEGIEGLFR